MLEKADLKTEISENDFKQQAKELKAALAALQQPIKQNKLPVIILFEGWGAAGKGSLISSLILNFDPRGFKVYSVTEPSEREKREPLLWRHWLNIPEQGKITVLDRSWYRDVSVARLEDPISDTENLRRMNDIKAFERQLTDSGYLIIKFFLHISKKEQKKRFEQLESSKNTQWRVTETDWKRNRRYEDYYRVFDEMLECTSTENAPWHVVSGMDKTAAELEVFRTVVVDCINAALKRQAKPAITDSPIDTGDSPLLPMPKLAEIPLDKTLDLKGYKPRLHELQDELSELHGKLYRKKVPVIIVYEGWDAAGKGGNIRRVAQALDPRGYEVIPIAAPDREEAARHYLWRFWKSLPKDGHIAIFDRSWYGRVMVERIEGFCTEEDWRRAYREINEFEEQLHDWGAVIIKFWLQIDKDEQLKRFQERQNTPSKQWKITDEDWRNRSKWEEYETAVNDMLQNTSTKFAPWHIIESQDKKYGRIQTLEIITDAIRKRF
ncbi:polyphosphate:AMP phosphotransferase [Caproiciproducens faecalis]|uniref:Polyphosphate:AMP phosphotransferase n=1 Tax=Caproiciproducens faecalis TaxID=2820301 RepID=A0ABS7DJ50_9FIRM|nr:polyphosphate:AMP phosphotransferase [Caproiciproducens faecalis]MBW7571320.1 polyphosphate:AMP phosphotransferase [Caproiciproducens faecalis]